MLCKNTGSSVARFAIDGLPGHQQKYAVKPGEEVEIADGYCKPYRNQTGRQAPPIVTQLHAAMQPTGRYSPGLEPLAKPADDVHTLKQQFSQLQAMFAEQQQMLRQLTQAAAASPPPAAPEPLPSVVVAPELTAIAPSGLEPAWAGQSEDQQVAELMKLKKADLVTVAIDARVDVDESMTKDDIAEAIVAKRRSGLVTEEDGT